MISLTLTVAGQSSTPIKLREGQVRLGSSADNELILDGPGVLPQHANIQMDKDGAVLHPAAPGNPVRLNQRLVQSMAFLNDGDRIELGSCTVLVTVQGPGRTAKGASATDDRATQVRRVPPRFLLRGVTGSQFGKLVPIYGKLVIGRDAECDLSLDEPSLSRRHALLETLPEGLFLRDLGSANGSHVNGKHVRDTPLRHGDQIEFDQVRFLVQAIDQTDTPPPAAPHIASNRIALRTLGMILLAAAAIGAGVVTLLLR